MKILKYTLLVLFLSLTSVIMYGCVSDTNPTPAIFKGLSGRLGQGEEQKVNNRLGERFPLGSKEADLVHELLAEGFKPAANVQARELSFDTLNNVIPSGCQSMGGVKWETDSNDKITSVSGFYSVDCL